MFFNKLKLYWQEILVSIFAFTYFIYFTSASLLRYTNFYTGKFDLGNMSQTVWNTLHGNTFMLTDPNGVGEISRLAVHADFILILITPFYLIWEDPRMLLIIQTLVLTFGGVFVYLIANKVLKNKTMALIFSFAYFLNPAVNWTNLYDFHGVTLATTFLLGGFYFILRKNYIVAIVFLIFAGITKEQIWAINVLLGLYLVIISKKRVIGGLFTIISAAIFYILFFIAIPEAAEGKHFALNFLSEYGNTPGEVIKNIILNPVMVIKTIFMPDRLGYIYQLFSPFGYLSFLALPILIFAAPDLSINLLSNFDPMHQIYYQYSASISPFIFIAAIYAVYLLRKYLPEIPINFYCIFIFILTLISAYNYGPTILAKNPNNVMFVSPLPIRNEIFTYIDTLQPDEKIAATNNLGAQLSHRKYIYVLPSGIEEADKVLILARNSIHEKEKIVLEELLIDPNFEIEYELNNFYVFKRIRL